jgi:hypothetical protein
VHEVRTALHWLCDQGFVYDPLPMDNLLKHYNVCKLASRKPRPVYERSQLLRVLELLVKRSHVNAQDLKVHVVSARSCALACACACVI